MLFRSACRMVKDKEADIPMKGLMQTASFMRAILDNTFMKQLSALGKRMLELGIIKKEPDYNALVDRRFVDALRQGK